MHRIFNFINLLILIVFSIPVFAQSNEVELLSNIRTHLPEAFENDAACSALLKEANGVLSTEPLLNGYIGGLYIARSRHAPLLDKRNALKKGTEMLEKAIRDKPNNIELLFLRLSIQLNLPGFLGYDDDIEKDKSFVLKNYKQAPPVLKSRIINFIKTSGFFTEEEQARVSD